jgi:uncharacterized membrane protein
MAAIRKSAVIDRSPEEIYRFWRNFNNLPRILNHLESVKLLGNGKSHWVIDTPAGKIEFDAKITEDRPNKFIKWRSLPGAEISSRGEVEFNRLDGDRTEVVFELAYDPPPGLLGKAISFFIKTFSAGEVEGALRQLEDEI